MKFAFVTCVELGLACIREIYRVGGELDLVITLKDRLAQEKSGRIYVDEFSAGHGIDVLKVGNVNEARAVEEIRARGIDWLFIIGWSQIAGAAVLQAPGRGVLGMHPTLLPIGRGRASIPWAILKGLPETGITLFQLDDGVDTGPILAQERVPIAADETATTLYRRIAEGHQALIRRIWPDLVADRIRPVPQDESRATSWPGRTPADGRITPAMTTSEADRLVRATTHPYPGAFWAEGGKIIRIWRGRVAPREAQPAPATPGVASPYRVVLGDGIYEALDYDVVDASAGGGAD